MTRISSLIKKIGENAASIKIFFNDFSDRDNSLSDYCEFAEFYLQTILKINDELLLLNKTTETL